MIVHKKLLLVATLITCFSAPATQAVEEELRTIDAQTLSHAFVSAVDKVSPAVVSINGERSLDTDELRKFESILEHFSDKFKDLLEGEAPRPKWQGSGVIIRSDGLVLTNNHVLEDADNITVVTAKDRQYPAEVVGRDPYTDIALIQIVEGPNAFPAAVLGDSEETEVGEWVLAIGSPFGLAGSVSEGIISAKNRTDEDVSLGRDDRFYYKDLIQTSAAINMGNSGGPLINLNGEVIGINNSIQTAGPHANLGIGFAVPSNMAKFVVDSLLEHGRVVRGWLGVRVDTLKNPDPEEWGTPYGALVLGVERNTPAEKAGLEQGDVIVAFDHKTIRSRPQLQNVVSQTQVGKEAALSIVRDKEQMDLNLVIEEYPRYLLEGSREQEETLMGFQVENLTARNRRKYAYPDGASGVVITKITEGSNAEKAGLEVGDLILEMENPIGDYRDYRLELARLLERVAERKEITVLLYIDRPGEPGGFPRYVSLKVQRPGD